MYRIDGKKDKLYLFQSLLDHPDSELMFETPKGRKALKIIFKEVFPPGFAKALTNCLDKLAAGQDPVQVMAELDQESSDVILDDYNGGTLSTEDLNRFMVAIAKSK